MCSNLGWCPGYDFIAAGVLVACIASGVFVGALGTLAWQELKHRREGDSR